MRTACLILMGLGSGCFINGIRMARQAAGAEVMLKWPEAAELHLRAAIWFGIGTAFFILALPFSGSI